ncbi:MAG: hypothetical protein MI923_12700 [Phycisphaerales bacterium]|nr:hypothetical protein [Phycisphaerales bacterium]
MIHGFRTMLVKLFARLIVLLPALVPCTHAFGQTGQATSSSNSSTSNPADDELKHGRKLLEDVRDHVFSFDHPAFYWFRDYVKQDSEAKYVVRNDDPDLPWNFLLERPSDYRGELVTIGGKLLKRHPPYKLSASRGSGIWYQYELGQAGTRAICTVIATEEIEKIPIRSRVRTKGYFIIVRAFKTDSGEEGTGPLLVARHLEPVGGLVGDDGDSDNVFVWLMAGTALLAVLWFVLRRNLRSFQSEPWSSSNGKAQRGESDEDFDWLTQGEERNKS